MNAEPRPRGSAEPDVVVVGAGLAGIACAHALQRQGYDVVILERERRPGGRVWTDELDGCRIELGAHFFNRRYASVMELVRAADLDNEIIRLSEGFVTAVLRAGRWHYFDYTRRSSLFRSRIVKLRQKMSLGLLGARLIPATRRLRFYDLASAASVDDRRPTELADPDALNYLTLPIYQAFCGYHLDELSSPFLALAVRYRFSTPLTVRGGLGRVVEVLGERLGVRHRYSVESVRVGPDGSVQIVAENGDGERVPFRARAAVLAVPSPNALAIWSDAPEPARRFLASMDYSPFLSVYLRTRSRFTPSTDRGSPVFMEVIPQGEREGVLEHVYYGANAIAPHGGAILAAAYADAASSENRDDVLATALQSELEELHPEVRGEVYDRRVTRWDAKVPVYPVGRVRDLAAFRQTLAPGPVQLAGDYLFGPVMEAAAMSGKEAAERVSRYLGSPGTSIVQRGLAVQGNPKEGETSS